MRSQLSGVPVYMMSHFTLAAFKVFLSWSLNIFQYDVVLWTYLCLSYLYLIELLEYVDLIFSIKFRKFPTTIFQIFLSSFLFSFWAFYYAHVGTLDSVLQFCEALLIFLHFLSFFSSAWIISDDLYSCLLILALIEPFSY